MALSRNLSQTVVALISIVAILLGALEHESLVLQNEAGAKSPPAGLAEGVECPSAASEVWTSFASDTGTEGTFRAESHTWGTTPFWRLQSRAQDRRQDLVFAASVAPLHLGRQARSRMTGVRARRL